MIIFAVMASNIHWEWGKGTGYAVPVLAICAAFIATVLLRAAIIAVRRLPGKAEQQEPPAMLPKVQD